MRLLTGALLVALSALAGCSGADPAPAPAAAEEAALVAAWEHDLPALSTGWVEVAAVSQRHWISAGSVDDSPGTTNPTPNVPLPYEIGDAETGAVTWLAPLGLTEAVSAVPGSDLFVALAGDRVGVIDPAAPAFVWSRRAFGAELVRLSATRIWMGRTTPDGRPICLIVASGREVRGDAACRATELAPAEVVDGVSWSENVRLVDLPGGARVEIPVVEAHDVETAQPLWSYGDAAVRVDGEDAHVRLAAFAGSGLGLVRVDYDGSEATLQLIDARTGEVDRALGTAPAGILIGFAGDVAVFEERHEPESAPRVVGYPVGD